MMSDRNNELLKYVGYGKGDNQDKCYFDGCGVIAEHYLLTARHCICGKCFFKFESGRTY